jgi:hypothetical protein
MSMYRDLFKRRSAKYAATGILGIATLAPLTAQAATAGHDAPPTLPKAAALTKAIDPVKAGPTGSTSHAGTVKVKLDGNGKPAAQPAAAPAAAPKDGYGTISMSQLIPNGTSGTQATFSLSKAQLDNARAIVQTAYKMHLPARAAVIAVATSMQETKLENLTVAVDHDSVGLFQQRPSAGWGTVAECTNPTYAATQFLNRLVQIPNWEHKALWNDAQTVQGSAFPYRYAQWEQHAAQVVQFVSQNS